MQSQIFDSFFPLQSMEAHRASVDSKEVKTLFDIWKNSSSSSNLSISADFDPTVVAALTTKGLIKFKRNQGYENQKIEITQIGKNIIRNLILHTEKSKFNKQSSSGLSEELINKAIYHTASRIEKDNSNNWLKRAWKLL